MCGLAGQLPQGQFKTCVGWQVSSHKTGSRLVWVGRSAPTRSVQDLWVGRSAPTRSVQDLWAGRSAFTRSVQDLCGLAGQLSQGQFKTCVGWQVSSHKISSRLVWVGSSDPTRLVQDLCGLAGQLSQGQFKTCVGWQVSSHKTGSRPVGAGLPAMAPWKSSRVFRIKTVHVQQNPHPATRLRPAQSPLS